MELNKSTCKLIAELEYIIGSECHNPNAYDGWTGIEGCNYRYPVNIPDSDGKYIKVRNKITDTAFFSIDDIKPTTIQYMKYKFGTNELMRCVGGLLSLKCPLLLLLQALGPIGTKLAIRSLTS